MGVGLDHSATLSSSLNTKFDNCNSFIQATIKPSSDSNAATPCFVAKLVAPPFASKDQLGHSSLGLG